MHFVAYTINHVDSFVAMSLVKVFEPTQAVISKRIDFHSWLLLNSFALISLKSRGGIVWPYS